MSYYSDENYCLGGYKETTLDGATTAPLINMKCLETANLCGQKVTCVCEEGFHLQGNSRGYTTDFSLCNTDDDCVLESKSCTGCECNYEAINRLYQFAYQDEKSKRCDQKEDMSPVCEMCCPYEARCQNGKCKVIDSGDGRCN